MPVLLGGLILGLSRKDTAWTAAGMALDGLGVILAIASFRSTSTSLQQALQFVRIVNS